MEILSKYTAGYVAPSVVTMYDGNVDFGGNLVIGCSQSGYAADVIAVIEKAKAQGAVTLAVTNDTQSPLAACADFHLYLNAGKEVSVAATKTFTTQLYAFLILACALGINAEILSKNIPRFTNVFPLTQNRRMSLPTLPLLSLRT